MVEANNTLFPQQFSIFIYLIIHQKRKQIEGPIYFLAGFEVSGRMMTNFQNNLFVIYHVCLLSILKKISLNVTRIVNLEYQKAAPTIHDLYSTQYFQYSSKVHNL